MSSNYKHSLITRRIIRAYFKVYNSLGYGFLEKVYENALSLEIQKMGLKVECQRQVHVFYDQKIVGDYFADLIVDDKVIVELKASETLRKEHEVQLVNYLKATNIEVGLLLNFGREPQFKRKVFSNKDLNKRKPDKEKDAD